MGEEQHIFMQTSQSFEAPNCYQLSCNFWVCTSVGQVLEKTPNPYQILTHLYARKVTNMNFSKTHPYLIPNLLKISYICYMYLNNKIWIGYLSKT